MAKKKRYPIVKKMESEYENEMDTINFVNALVDEGINYREQFEPGWNEVISQIRCELPANNKEDWQTKVFIPLQAKGSEVIVAYYDKMLWGSKNFFSMYAAKSSLLGYTQPLQDLINSFLDNGRFVFAKNFALEECVNIGTSFIKVLAKRDKSGFDFIWRSAYSVVVDAGARHDFYKARFCADVYRKDINDIINESKMPNSEWDKDAVKKLLELGVMQREHEQAKKSGENSSELALASVRNIDGTATEFILSAFADVEIVEYWGKVKTWTSTIDPATGKEIKYCTYEDRCLKIANGSCILANDKNEYGQIPFFPMRNKVRTYDFYAKGSFLDTRGIQDLTNSTVALGFDSVKISSMDIIMLDKSRVNDQASIVYEPLAIWDVKDPQNVRLTRQGMSALTDTLRGLAFLDGMHQDTTGATRQAQGTQAVPGVAGGNDNTLGEYQYKMQMVDQRFLKQAKFIEDDFELPMLRFILRQIFNNKLISQDVVNKKLGFNVEPILNPETGEPTGATQKIPVLDLSKMLGELNWTDSSDWVDPDIDFTIVGLNQFVEKVTILQKLDGIINRAIQNPAFAPYANINKTVKRWFELSDIPDWKELYMESAPATPPPPPVMPNGKVPNTQMPGQSKQGQSQPAIPMQ